MQTPRYADHRSSAFEGQTTFPAGSSMSHIVVATELLALPLRVLQLKHRVGAPKARSDVLAISQNLLVAVQACNADVCCDVVPLSGDAPNVQVVHVYDVGHLAQGFPDLGWINARRRGCHEDK